MSNSPTLRALDAVQRPLFVTSLGNERWLKRRGLRDVIELDWWQTHHTDVLNRGDLLREDCLQCHEVERSCNNCHRYVGAEAIIP